MGGNAGSRFSGDIVIEASGLKRTFGEVVAVGGIDLAVARGEVAVGLVNHYYINRHLAKNPKAPIAQLLPDQGKQGMGIVLNAAGVGITAQTKHLAQAKALVEFLISEKGQQMFSSVNKEYPLNANVDATSELKPLKSFQVASVPLSRLAELRDPTMTVIEHVGLR